MGDRKCSRSPIELARDMLADAMDSGPTMRDELYAHIMRQTTNNPNPLVLQRLCISLQSVTAFVFSDSTAKGWEMMTFCLACFPAGYAISSMLCFSVPMLCS